MYFRINICIFLIIMIQAKHVPIRILRLDDIIKYLKSVRIRRNFENLKPKPTYPLATKTAAHFISEINTRETNADRDYDTAIRWRELLRENTNEGKSPQMLNSIEEQVDWSKVYSEKLPDQAMQNSSQIANHTESLPLLNEEQAMTLLADPSPDGDNLGEQLSDTEDSKPIPVIGITKINGKYYRRLLGII